MKIQSNKLSKKNPNKEAKYWEENFDTEWEKGKLIKTKADSDLSQTITVSLKPSLAKAVFKVASKKDVDPVQMVMHWIQEKTKPSHKPNSV